MMQYRRFLTRACKRKMQFDCDRDHTLLGYMYKCRIELSSGKFEHFQLLSGEDERKAASRAESADGV